MASYSASKPDLQARLRRIEGQVRGLQRLIDEDTYCIDVLTQISATTKALQAVANSLLADHMNHCVIQAAQSSRAEGEEKVQEVMTALNRFAKA